MKSRTYAYRNGLCLVIASTLLQSLTIFAQPTFSFNLVQPQSGAIVGTQLSVQVGITSTYQLNTVTATVAGQTSNLMFSSAASAWTNTLSLLGLSRGTNTLILAATDVFGNSGQMRSDFLKDLPPTLNVTEPAPGTVARPGLRLDVTAGDEDSAGAIINVYSGVSLVATGTNTIHTNATIPGNDGQAIDLTIEAVDSVGQKTSIVRTVYVFTSNAWQELARVEGPILDFETNTILFVDGNVLKTKSLDSGTVTVLLDDPSIIPESGSLTPAGAIFTANYTTYEIRGTNLLNLGQAYLVDVKGNYALLQSNGSGLMTLRNLAVGTNDTITAAPGYSGGYGGSLAPNGDVVYPAAIYKGTPTAVFRFRDGTNSLLVDSGFRYIYRAVGSDGNSVVYAKLDGLNFFGPGDAAMFVGSTETILATNSYGGSGPVINQGWIAFTAYDALGHYQIWTRSPTGTIAQQTFFGASSDIIALAPNGEVIFLSGGRLYRASNSSLPLDLGAWNFWSTGKVSWQGRWYFQLGRSLFGLSQLPFIASAGWQNGKFKLTVEGNPGDTVIVQTSSNLRDWSPIYTNIVTNPNFEVVDPASIRPAGLFYRAVAP
jgi:hypothetical protein